jgi:hypothetical protein
MQCNSAIGRIGSLRVADTASDRGSIATSIGSQIAGDGQTAQGSGKARILLRLGLGLAVVYVLFLSLWFRITRGRVARRRVVRF